MKMLVVESHRDADGKFAGRVREIAVNPGSTPVLSTQILVQDLTVTELEGLLDQITGVLGVLRAQELADTTEDGDPEDHP